MRPPRDWWRTAPPLIGQQKAILDDFIFEGQTIHLKSLEHRPATIKQDLALEQPFGGRQLALQPA